MIISGRDRVPTLIFGLRSGLMSYYSSFLSGINFFPHFKINSDTLKLLSIFYFTVLFLQSVYLCNCSVTAHSLNKIRVVGQEI